MARLVAERADIIPILAETFRAHGYKGTSLAVISEATGLGKGSLYHFFPGGKEEMADAVLANIDAWFKRSIFEPLRTGDDPRTAIATMFEQTTEYFDSGGRVCVVGLFALGDERDRFAAAISGYFREWTDCLAACLIRGGCDPATAQDLAEDTVAGVQGAIVLARSVRDRAAFTRAIERLRRRIGANRVAGSMDSCARSAKLPGKADGGNR